MNLEISKYTISDEHNNKVIAEINYILKTYNIQEFKAKGGALSIEEDISLARLKLEALNFVKNELGN